MIALLLFLAQAPFVQVPFDKVLTHPYVCVDGLVTYVRKQADGDWHITLDDGKGRILVTEIVPQLPFPPAKKGQRVRACGVSRPDERHGWNEVHPLLKPFEVLK